MKREVKEHLVSYGKPYKLVTSDTVSSCIKDGFPPAGASVIVYKAHISRSPSLSKARYHTWYHLYKTYLNIVGKGIVLKTFDLKDTISRCKKLKNLEFDYDAPLLSYKRTAQLLYSNIVIFTYFLNL